MDIHGADNIPVLRRDFAKEAFWGEENVEVEYSKPNF